MMEMEPMPFAVAMAEIVSIIIIFYDNR